MSENLMVWICILVATVGLSVASGIAWFGHVVFLRQTAELYPHFLENLFHRWAGGPGGPPDDNIPRHLAESYAEFLQRRNEFWTAYGQVLLAVLIVTILAILILTKAISAEAGLPILSGVSGFAIAKSASSSRTVNVPQERTRG